MSILVLSAIGIIGLLAAYSQVPSNNKDWEVGFEIFPETKISKDQTNVEIKNIRDWNYSQTDIISKDYIDRTYNIDNLERVWFLVEPFSKWDGIAHTYFVFDFTDQEAISFSIEARREKGEEYFAALGAVNQYELIYMWGTERDFTGRRIYKDDADVYMYPLNIQKVSGQKLFLELARSTEELRNNPKFYNTLTSNCTNNLAKSANNVKAGTIPFNIAQILPGYSDEFLYGLDYIPTNESLDKVREKYYITDIVNEVYTDPNFSSLLRERIK